MAITPDQARDIPHYEWEYIDIAIRKIDYQLGELCFGKIRVPDHLLIRFPNVLTDPGIEVIIELYSAAGWIVFAHNAKDNPQMIEFTFMDNKQKKQDWAEQGCEP